MKVQLETITPKKAAEWLKANTTNRPINQSWVNRLAETIADGQWRLNGDTIRFNDGGTLIDGQHRLHAILIANKPIKSYVVYGLQSEAFDTIDNVNRRSNSDRLARRGEKHYVTLAAAVGRLWAYLQKYPPYACCSPRPDQMDDVLNKHPGIRDAVDFALGLNSRLLPPSDASFFIYIGRSLWGREITDRFWDSVLTANKLSRGTVAYLLFKRLDAHRTDPANRMSRDYRYALCVKAFNAHATGQNLKVLKCVDGEEFPRFAEPKK